MSITEDGTIHTLIAQNANYFGHTNFFHEFKWPFIAICWQVDNFYRFQNVVLSSFYVRLYLAYITVFYMLNLYF
jgi:hypothetical protein